MYFTGRVEADKLFLLECSLTLIFTRDIDDFLCFSNQMF